MRAMPPTTPPAIAPPGVDFPLSWVSMAAAVETTDALTTAKVWLAVDFTPKVEVSVGGLLGIASKASCLE